MDLDSLANSPGPDGLDSDSDSAESQTAPAAAVTAPVAANVPAKQVVPNYVGTGLLDLVLEESPHTGVGSGPVAANPVPAVVPATQVGQNIVAPAPEAVPVAPVAANPVPGGAVDPAKQFGRTIEATTEMLDLTLIPI